MASKAFYNTFATIAIASGMATGIQEKIGYCFGLEVFNLLEAVKDKASSAFELWPTHIDREELKTLEKMIGLFEIDVKQTDQDLTSYTSTVISMLEDLKEVLMEMRSSRAKIVAISELLEAVIHVHSAFDPELQFEDGYITAKLLHGKWEKILEAA